MFEKLFPNNEHSIERIIRVSLGIVLLALIFVGPRSWWGLVGIVPLLTGLLGSCPIYTVLGVSTCKVDTSNKPVRQGS